MNVKKIPSLLIVAGGTGGHVFPALAIAEAFQERGGRVHWLGTTTGLEHRVVPAHNISFTPLPAAALRGKGFLGKCRALFLSVRAFFRACSVLRQERPDWVLGFGGYVTGAVGLAAFFSRVPLAIHEQNTVMGLSNRCLAPLAKKIFLGFSETRAAHVRKTLWVGNPVRASLLTLPKPDVRLAAHEGPIRVLVLGGSQGAAFLNQCLPKTIALLSKDGYVFRLQTGRLSEHKVRETCTALGLSNVRVEAFIEDMAEAYAWADMVVARSGALTVAELAAVGLPSVLIPFPGAVDDHQWHNAMHLVACGAAQAIRQEVCTEADVSTRLLSLGVDRVLLAEAGVRAYRCRSEDAVSKVLEALFPAGF